MMKHTFAKIALTALALLFSMNQEAWAGCSSTGWGTVHLQLPSDSVRVPSGTTVGTTVWTGDVTTSSIRVTCTNGAHAIAYHEYAPSRIQSGLVNVYATDVPFLGFRIIETHDSKTVENSESSWVASAPDFSGDVTFSYQISLVVIGPVGTSTASNIGGSLVHLRLGDSEGNFGEWHALHSSRFAVEVASSACTITTANANVIVNLGTYQASMFKGIGSGTPPSPFSLRLNNCPPAIKYEFAPVTTVVPNTGESVVELTSTANSAKGVGVQLLNDAGAPLALRTKFDASDASGEYAIPLQARFYQTADSVTPGTANSAMTFIITYQ